jgi:hypothetical protein
MQATKTYYHSKELMIIGKATPGVPLLNGGKEIGEMTDMEYFAHKVGRGRLQGAHEVWAYNPQNRSFACVKNKSGTATILMSFLVSKGIHIRPDVAELNTAMPIRFRFVDEKDHFLFQLKF